MIFKQVLIFGFLCLVLHFQGVTLKKLSRRSRLENIPPNIVKLVDTTCLANGLTGAPAVENADRMSYLMGRFNSAINGAPKGFLVAAYVCNQGYKFLNGNNKVYCSEGKWIGVVPMCIKSDESNSPQPDESRDTPQSTRHFILSKEDENNLKFGEYEEYELEPIITQKLDMHSFNHASNKGSGKTSATAREINYELDYDNDERFYINIKTLTDHGPTINSLLRTTTIASITAPLVINARSHDKQETHLSNSNINHSQVSDLVLRRVKRAINLPSDASLMCIHNLGNVDFYGSSSGAYYVNRGTNSAVLVQGTENKKITKIDVYSSHRTSGEYNVFFVMEDDTKIKTLGSALYGAYGTLNNIEEENNKQKQNNNNLHNENNQLKAEIEHLKLKNKEIYARFYDKQETQLSNTNNNHSQMSDLVLRRNKRGNNLPSDAMLMCIHNLGNVDFYGSSSGAYYVNRRTNSAVLVLGTENKKITKIDVYGSHRRAGEYNVFFVMEDDNKIKKLGNALDGTNSKLNNIAKENNDLKQNNNNLEDENNQLKSEVDQLKLKTKELVQEHENKFASASLEVINLQNKLNVLTIKLENFEKEKLEMKLNNSILRQQLEHKNNETNKLKVDLENCTIKLSSNQSEIKDLQNKLNDDLKTISNCNSTATKLTQDLEMRENERKQLETSLQSELNDLDNRNKNIAKHKLELEKCLTVKTDEINQLKNELKASNLNITNLNCILTDLKNKIKNLQVEKDKVVKLKEDIQNQLNTHIEYKGNLEKDLEIERVKVDEISKKLINTMQEMTRLVNHNEHFIDEVIEYAKIIKKIENLIKENSALGERIIFQATNLKLKENKISYY